MMQPFTGKHIAVLQMFIHFIYTFFFVCCFGIMCMYGMRGKPQDMLAIIVGLLAF